MNDAQTQLNVGGGSLNATRNPQTIPIQNLGAPSQNNLQNPTATFLSQTGLNITSVGSQQFSPLSTTSTSTVSNLPADTSSSAAPLIIGFIVILVLFAAIVIWAVKNDQPTPKS